MSAVLSPMKALVTLAMMLELFRGRPSARYTFRKKRAQGRSEGNPSGIRRFLRRRKKERRQERKRERQRDVTNLRDSQWVGV